MSERLTMFTPCGYVECDPIDVYQNEYSPENFEKILTKLGCYEDLEEEGRLIKLPCAIGDKLFFIKKIGKVMNVIGILGVLSPDYGETKALREEIEALDMAMKSLKDSTIENNSTVESEWIPITDRLPENNSTEPENVLISTDEGDVQIGFYDDEEKTWSIYCDDGTAWPVTAVAWMPLPKPYREGTDEA